MCSTPGTIATQSINSQRKVLEMFSYYKAAGRRFERQLAHRTIRRRFTTFSPEPEMALHCKSMISQNYPLHSSFRLAIDKLYY
ncbi:predicted protein [Sclerotinia sclerotiorum 1980 UF-70]|uniref:Uncharacterized protein n=1 Tax=Sclerotinia sclerotiorum (strain ATCC 18683 / 1980 / Ss-1) TaxID=665079 RepID=A7EV23_SCLS1|nr:predicted protein [Sclerotinia sclerotiorum 1980 UF-70]EDN93315.1 predicted protein [Sclerotinia sclerotiorum 1980 UF-70]